MRVIPRWFTAALALPIWVVTILTSGQWCLMSGSANAHVVVSSAGGAGHAAHARQQAGAAVAHVAHGAHGGHAPAMDPEARHVEVGAVVVTSTQHDPSTHAPASHGDAGLACESQAACSVPMLAAAHDDAATPNRALAALAAWSRGEPDSRTAAPELPPPRA